MNTQKATKVLDQLFSSTTFQKMNRDEIVSQFSKSEALRNNNKSTQRHPSSYVPHSASNINSIPPEGIVITNPGQYHFTNDITWSPTSAGSAIWIFANDVVLNLNGFKLNIQLPSSPNEVQFNGISLGISDDDLTTCNAITVENGIISGASYYGVNAQQTTNAYLNQLTITDIKYKETSKADLTACGIFIDKSSHFNIQNCTVQNIEVTAPSCAGIQIVSSENGNLSGCTLENFLNNDGGVQGFSYLESNKINTNGCKSKTFRSHYLGLTQTTGHTVIGYVPIMCTELVYNDCSSDGMTGCCDDCHGFSVFLNSDVTVTNFTATNILDGDCKSNTGAKATGLEVYGDNITIENCTSRNIHAIVPQDLQSAGFSAWGNKISFNNCTAHNVKVLNAEREPTTTLGYGAGFGWAPDPRKEFKDQAANEVQYNNCETHDSQLGFDTWFHTNSKWNNVMTYECEIFILAEPSGTPRTLSMNKCSESPTGLPIEVTIKNIAINNDFPKVVHS